MSLDDRSKEYAREDLRMSIIRNPNNLLGSISTQSIPRLIYDQGKNKIVMQTIQYNEGLHKLFDEIITNALDHQKRQLDKIEKQNLIREGKLAPSETLNLSRSYKPVTQILIDIDPSRGIISIQNNGNGIPVDMHPTYKIPTPQLIFGELLSGSNSAEGLNRRWGGMNQLGAKLVNIFSANFQVDTVDHERQARYVQTWSNRMATFSEPLVTKSTSEPYTKITYQIEPSAFKDLEENPYPTPASLYTPEALAYIHRRILDVAALSGECVPPVSIHINGKRVTTPHNLMQYSTLYLGTLSERKRVALPPHRDWNIIVATSEEFQQISFINGVFTGYETGTHVDHIVKPICEFLAKEYSTDKLPVTPAQVKQNLWILVDATLNNPEFSDQKKTKMTLKQSKFSSSYPHLTPETIKQLSQTLKLKPLILETAQEQSDQKAQRDSKKATNRRVQAPKLIPAQLEGKTYCTLAIVEGDSARASVIHAISTLPDQQRRAIGIFPIRGKMINTRELSLTKIRKNAEIEQIMAIMGLDFTTDYSVDKNYNNLRYHRILVMADADHDGYHIQGLIFNFFHSMWPQLLLRPNFIQTIAIPIIKANNKKTRLNFYTQSDFRKWAAETPDASRYTVKYFKGLATYLKDDAKKWFTEGQLISFEVDKTSIAPTPTTPPTNATDFYIILSFMKSNKKGWDGRKMSDWRKDWLSSYSINQEEDAGFDPHETRVTYSQQLQRRYLPAAVEFTRRAVPSVMDGLKPSQRKVLCGIMSRPSKASVKVSVLAGYVTEKMAYHYGDSSLNDTIIGMAQDFPGSNNINLLYPEGNFGSRQGGGSSSSKTAHKQKIGADAGAPRYIYTFVQPITELIFDKTDNILLDYEKDDGIKIEPKYYIPSIPMILVNGSSGIGVGYNTSIAQHNPVDIIENLRNLIHDKPIKPLTPWFRNFQGRIKVVNPTKTLVYGSFHWEAPNRLVITELPVGSTKAMSFQSYKNFLENLITPPVVPPSSTSSASTTLSTPHQILEKRLKEQLVTHLREILQHLRIVPADHGISKPCKQDLINLIIKNISQVDIQNLLKMLPEKKRAKRNLEEDDPSDDENPSDDDDNDDSDSSSDDESTSSSEPTALLEPLTREWAINNILGMPHDLTRESGPLFIIEFRPESLHEIAPYPKRVFDLFKLRLSIKNNNMYLFNSEGRIRLYRTTTDIMTDYFKSRLELYFKRYQRLLEQFTYRFNLSSAKARFVEEVLYNRFQIRDPVSTRPLTLPQWEFQLENYSPPFPRLGKTLATHLDAPDLNYEYLTSLPMSSLTEENLNALKKQTDENLQTLNNHKASTPQKLWLDDLDKIEHEWRKILANPYKSPQLDEPE